ncbi:MAG: hypothetical protein JWM44_531 [Bacilli bacterium]|nr:hypothetical protein [Bacilli bacterium]
MSYGFFSDAGSEYVVTTPKTPVIWSNYLFNDAYYLEVSQTGQGSSTSLMPAIRQFTRGFRYFYLKDEKSSQYWNPLYAPLKSDVDEYSCTHALSHSEFISKQNGIRTRIHVFVPAHAACEIWTVTIRNESDLPRSIFVYSVFSMENGGLMGSKCDYDSERHLLYNVAFPYHVKYEDKFRFDRYNSYTYMFSDVDPKFYDCSEQRFFGSEDLTEVPIAVLNGNCSNTAAEGENPVGAFQHQRTIEPGEAFQFKIVIGIANDLDEAKEVQAKFLREGHAEELLVTAKQHWNSVCELFQVETPDQDLNHFVNHWLKKQVSLMTRTNRLSAYSPVRNQLQDAVGYSMLDGEGAAQVMLKVTARQEPSGFIQQWYMTDGSAPRALCLLNHKDAPIWLVYCLCELVQQTGDVSLLQRMVPFKDSPEKATVYDHLLRAIFYMAKERGEHGLILMGDGDWTDPINGAGRLGRGESTWSTVALKFAIQQFLPFVERLGDQKQGKRLEELARELDEAVNSHCWDGDWYIAGFDDNGIPFGCREDEEGQLFLNAQTWAIICGTARGERLEKCRNAVVSLDTPFGPRLLDPPFTKWNETWGRISIKLAGTTENGSVYCHASMFKALSDLVRGDGNSAYDTIRKTMPTNTENPPEKNLQIPIYVPNYYFGLQKSDNFGLSSRHHSTGTAAWMMWLVVDRLLGIQATIDGLKVNPCIPGEWKEYRIKRKFRNSLYEITVRNPKGLQTGSVQIQVDGLEWSNHVLPNESGITYRVDVQLD